MDHWIGGRLKTLSVAQGIKQGTLALAVRRSQSWMSDVLNDKVDPGFHEVEVLARTIGIPLEALVRNPGAITGLSIALQVTPTAPAADQ